MTIVLFLDADWQPLRIEPWTRAITDLFLGALIGCAQEAGARVIGYLFTSPLDACRLRNASRDARTCVPNVGIFATVKRFQAPSLGEGFDQLWRIDTLPDFRFEVKP